METFNRGTFNIDMRNAVRVPLAPPGTRSVYSFLHRSRDEYCLVHLCDCNPIGSNMWFIQLGHPSSYRLPPCLSVSRDPECEQVCADVSA